MMSFRGPSRRLKDSRSKTKHLALASAWSPKSNKKVGICWLHMAVYPRFDAPFRKFACAKTWPGSWKPRSCRGRGRSDPSIKLFIRGAYGWQAEPKTFADSNQSKRFKKYLPDITLRRQTFQETFQGWNEFKHVPVK